jgi:hypothetical protein
VVNGGDHMEYDVMIRGFEETVFVIGSNVSAPLAAGRSVGATFASPGLSLLPVIES